MTPAVERHDELLAMQPRRNRHEPPQQPDHRVLLGLQLPLRRPQHLHAREDEERAEHQHDHVVLHERRTDGDERRAEDEGADDAVEQHPVLVERRDAEVGEHQDEHEDVVDGERLLDDVAGEELEPELAAGVRAERGRGVEVEAVVERERQRHPHHRPAQRLAERDDVGLPMEDAEIDGEQHEDEACEARVEPPVFDERKEEVHAVALPGDPMTLRTGAVSSD